MRREYRVRQKKRVGFVRRREQVHQKKRTGSSEEESHKRVQIREKAEQ